MEREEAVALFKELILRNLALPFLVDLRKNKQGKLDLIINADFDALGLGIFMVERKLTLFEDKEKGYCIISKP